jgi:hypothetical protein
MVLFTVSTHSQAGVKSIATLNLAVVHVSHCLPNQETDGGTHTTTSKIYIRKQPGISTLKLHHSRAKSLQFYSSTLEISA